MTGRKSVLHRWRFSAAAGLLCWTPTMGFAEEHVIRIVSDYDNLRMMFVPKFLRIEPGDQVTWINEANEEHNVITFPDGFPEGASAFQSPLMARVNEEWSHRFDIVGTYEYHCLPHLPMGMHGLIIVGRPSRNDEFHEPSAAEVAAYRKLMLQWFDEEDIEDIEQDREHPDMPGSEKMAN